MLKKIILALVLLGLAVGAAWAGTAWFAGARVEKDLQARVLQRFNHPILKVVEQKHERSLAGSSGHIVFAIDPACFPKAEEGEVEGAVKAPDVRVVYRYDVAHGPSLDGWQAARVDGRLELEGEMQKKLAKHGIPAVFATHHTQLGFDGKGRSRIDLPGWTAKFENETLTWHGMSGTSSSDNTGKMQLELSGKGLEGGNVSGMVMSIGPIKVASDLEYIDPRFAIGTSDLNIDYVSAGQGPMSAQVKGLRVYTNAKRGDAELLDVDAGLTVREGVSMGAAFRNARAEFAVRRLHAQTVLDLDRTMNGHGCAELEPALQAKANAEGRKLAVKILSFNPEFEIKSIAVENAAGNFEVAARVRTRDIKDEDFGSPDGLSRKIDIEGRGQVPVALLQSIPVAEAWLMEGLLTMEANSVKTAMKYTGGVLSLNGKVVEPAQLMAQMQGPPPGELEMEESTGQAFAPPTSPGAPGKAPKR